MARIVKSALWLLGFGGLGYCLLKITTPDESHLLSQLPERFHSERTQRRNTSAALVDVLKNAAEAKEPLYRQTRDQIEQTVINKK